MHGHPHPTEFYVAHALFAFFQARQQVTKWGSLSDGPCDRHEVLDYVREHFRAARPNLANLRVFHFQSDAPARDVTEDMIAVLMEDAA